MGLIDTIQLYLNKEISAKTTIFQNQKMYNQNCFAGAITTLIEQKVQNMFAACKLTWKAK
jgi:hypothetical protein